MIYPSLYRDCQNLAVDVSETHQFPGKQFTAQINAVSGKFLSVPLANDLVWAGFPGVNQVNPRLIAFAGQFDEEEAATRLPRPCVRKILTRITSRWKPGPAGLDRGAPQNRG
jgi:hypothetical protein